VRAARPLGYGLGGMLPLLFPNGTTLSRRWHLLVFTGVAAIAFPLIAISAVGGVAALLVRYRRSVGVERLQLRWLVLAAWLAVTVLGVEIVTTVHSTVSSLAQFVVVAAIPGMWTPS